MSDQPAIFYDFEFRFLGAEPLYVTAKDGDWSLANRPDGILLQIRQDGAMDEYHVNKAALAYLHTTKREVPPEVTTDGAGSIRIIGGTDSVQ